MSRLGTLAAAAILAVGCSPAPSTSPHAVASTGAGATPPIADVLTYKAGMTRVGAHPGPGPAAQPVVLWEIDLPSGPMAAPLIVDGNVISIGEDGTVKAVDGATGAVEWSGAMPTGVTITPTIAGGTLYAVTADGVLRTMSLADQDFRWTADGFLADSQVTVVGGVVLAGAPGEIVAMAAADGVERWRADAGGSARAAADGEVAYVSGAGSGDLVAVTLGDGSTRWTHETTSATVLTPGIADGNVYVAARDAVGGRNLLYALAPDGHELWHWTGRDIIASNSISADRVFVSYDDPATGIAALDRSTGDVLWTRELTGSITGILALADGALYLPTTGEGLTAVDAATSEVRWRFALDGATQTQVAVSGGLVFVGARYEDGSGRLIALAGPADPRIGNTASPPPAATTAPATEPPAAVRILSADDVPGQTLLLTTAAAPDGTMYVADLANSRIIVRSPEGTIEHWGEFGSEPGQFNFTEVTRNDNAAGVAVSPDGQLIAVGDGGNHRVQLFDADRKFLRPIGRLGREDGQFVNPCCLAVDARHRIWVVDAGREDVQVFSETGEHLRTFAGSGHGDGQLSRPGSIFVDEEHDRVYVGDFANRRVAVFSTDGSWIAGHGGVMADGQALGEVNDVEVDRTGRMFVLEASSKMHVLDADGTPVAVMSSDLPDIGLVELATFALDHEGRLYFADIGAGQHARLVIAQLNAPLWPPD